MTLRKYNGFAEECGDEGAMQIAVTASEGEYRTIDQWMERNNITLRSHVHPNKDAADCIYDPQYSVAGKRYRRYTFRLLTPSVVGFRLSFSTSRHRFYDDALFLSYCDRIIHRTTIMPVPRTARSIGKDMAGDFFRRVHEWCRESGVRLVNLAELFREDDLPLRGRVMFIHYRVGSPYFMSAVMFTEASDAVLYKMSFAD